MVYRLPEFFCPSGRLVASDPMIGGAQPFVRRVDPGRYAPLLICASDGSEQVAFAAIQFSTAPIQRWELAEIEGFNGGLPSRSYGVDSGTGCFFDSSFAQVIAEVETADGNFFEEILPEFEMSRQLNRGWLHLQSAQGSMVAFPSGGGDGAYRSYFALASSDRPAALVTDFGILPWEKPI